MLIRVQNKTFNAIVCLFVVFLINAPPPKEGAFIRGRLLEGALKREGC